MAKETWEELFQRHNNEKTELHNNFYLQGVKLNEQQEAEQISLGKDNKELEKKHLEQKQELLKKQNQEDKKLNKRHFSEQEKFIEREKKIKEMLENQRKLLEKSKGKER
jgi:hypothetical protein